MIWNYQHYRKKKNSISEELNKTMATNVSELKRHYQQLQNEEASYSIDVPPLENVLDEILPKRLWHKDHSKS